MARDRLAAMRSVQTGSDQLSPHQHSLAGNANQPGHLVEKEKELDLDHFMNQVSELNDTIKTINSNLDRIKDLQQQSLSELDLDRSHRHQGSSTSADLIELSSRTSYLIKNCKHRITSSQSLILSSGQPQGQFNVQLTQISALKKRLMDSIMKFQAVEQEFRQKSQARIERQYRIVKPDATPEEIREVIEGDQSAHIFSQALMTSNRYGDARAAFNEVKERHQQLKRIETTLTELMEMFNDLATMVDEQDQVVQNVEAAAIEAEQDMEQAGGHVKKARDSAAAARRKRWYCFFICLLILAIAGAIVAIVVVTNKK